MRVGTYYSLLRVLRYASPQFKKGGRGGESYHMEELLHSYWCPLLKLGDPLSMTCFWGYLLKLSVISRIIARIIEKEIWNGTSSNLAIHVTMNVARKVTMNPMIA